MHKAEGAALDPQHLRQALGRFATGVTIVTCLDRDGQRVGLTANSFNALSLDPPLILWSLRLKSPSLQAFVSASHFAVNVLARDQQALSRHFSRSGPDKFSLGVWSQGVGGVPVLEGSVARFECRQHTAQEAGDHILFIGQVLQAQAHAHAPLVFQGGRYRVLGEALED